MVSVSLIGSGAERLVGVGRADAIAGAEIDFRLWVHSVATKMAALRLGPREGVQVKSVPHCIDAPQSPVSGALFNSGF